MAGSCQIDNTIDIKSADVDKTGQVFALFLNTFYIMVNSTLLVFFFRNQSSFYEVLSSPSSHVVYFI